MARPKSVSSAVLVRIFREYCMERGATSPEEVRFSDLSRYASERGVDAPRYLFARDREVRAELDALRPAIPWTSGPCSMPAGTTGWPSREFT